MVSATTILPANGSIRDLRGYQLMQWKVPLFETDFGEAESQAVLSVLRSGWLTMGPVVEEFEAEFARRTGCPHAVAVASCTAGLHLALLAAGIRPGDEVIVPSLSFLA